MKKQKISENSIISILKQYKGEREYIDVCRVYGIIKATLYNQRNTVQWHGIFTCQGAKSASGLRIAGSIRCIQN